MLGSKGRLRPISILTLTALFSGCLAPEPVDEDGDDDDDGGSLFGGTGGTAGVAGTSAGGTIATGGTVGAGGTSAGVPATGGGTGEPMPACRAYATSQTFTSSLGASYSTTCTHAETANAFTRTCTLAGSTTTEFWANKGAFIDEAAAVGIVKLQSSTTQGYQTVYAYDAQGRLTSLTVQGSLYATYDAWDARSRPTHMVYAGQCSGSTGTITYDDGARSITQAAGGTCASRTTVFYDANIIPVAVDYGDGTTAAYTTQSRANVCR